MCPTHPQTLSFYAILLLELSKMRITSVRLSLSEILSRASYLSVERLATGLLRQGLHPHVLLVLDVACRHSGRQDEYLELTRRVFSDLGQPDSARGYVGRNSAAVLGDLVGTVSTAEGTISETSSSFFEALQLWGLDCDSYGQTRPSPCAGTVLLGFIKDLLFEHSKGIDFFRIRKNAAQLGLDTIKESIEVCSQLDNIAPKDVTRLLNYTRILREGQEGSHQAALRSLLNQVDGHDWLYFYCMARTLEASNRSHDNSIEYCYSTAASLVPPEHRSKVDRARRFRADPIVLDRTEPGQVLGQLGGAL